MLLHPFSGSQEARFLRIPSCKYNRSLRSPTSFRELTDGAREQVPGTSRRADLEVRGREPLRSPRVVPDVEQFPGHIACDAGSRSEIVVPIVVGDRVVAVLDLDSYDLASFDETDAAGLAPVAELLGTLAW